MGVSTTVAPGRLVTLVRIRARAVVLFCGVMKDEGVLHRAAIRPDPATPVTAASCPLWIVFAHWFIAAPSKPCCGGHRLAAGRMYQSCRLPCRALMRPRWQAETGLRPALPPSCTGCAERSRTLHAPRSVASFPRRRRGAGRRALRSAGRDASVQDAGRRRCGACHCWLGASVTRGTIDRVPVFGLRHADRERTNSMATLPGAAAK